MSNFAVFRILRVKCRDEMGGKYRERFGNDEIRAAVFTADLRGTTVNSGKIHIYDHFDDNDEIVFNPPREAVTIDLGGSSGTKPLAVSVILYEEQIRSGNGLDKAWQAFVTLYEEKLDEELKK